MKYQAKSDFTLNSRDEELRDHQVYHKAYHLECEFCCDIFRVMPGFNFTLFVEKKRKYRKVLLVPYQPHEFCHVYGRTNTFTISKNKKNLKCCPLCDAHFARSSDQLRHFKTVHTEESFDCDVCDHKFNRKDNLLKHINEAHENCGGEFCCEDCNVEFRSYRAFKSHRLSKMEAKCNICEDMFCTSKVLKMHIKSEHV